MPVTFVRTTARAGWTWFNQHMNAANTRLEQETRCGSSMHTAEHGRVHRLHLGPVVVEDRLTYRSELRLLEPFQVDLVVAGISATRKMRCGTTSAGLPTDAVRHGGERHPLVRPGARKAVALLLRCDLWLAPRTDDFAPM